MSASSQTKTGGRTAELEFEINAKPGDVWAAITEAERLASWFPLTARVEPGEGGTMFMAWGDEFQGECAIEIWEPNRRLRTTFMEGADGEPMRTHVDYFLEGKGGVTTLRLVHSGFGEGAEWDRLYNGVSRGWASELRSLKHYMEHHFGAKRGVSWAVVPFEMQEPEVWSLLMGERCLGIGSADALGAGDRFHARGPVLGSVNGTVLLAEKPGVLVGTIDELNNAFFRLELEHCSGPRPSVWFWVSAYGASVADTEALTARINGALSELIA
jgi:uncharacterized protein YndB with AHSA1/START domain